MSSNNDTTSYHIHSLHRGKFIWILLGSLFLLGYLLSYADIREIVKIIILLFSIPAALFAGAKFSYQASTWHFTDQTIRIQKPGKDIEIPIADIAYIKNHMRSGGNLLGIYREKKSTPIRIWRNKLFVAQDDFDAMLQQLKALGIEIIMA